MNYCKNNNSYIEFSSKFPNIIKEINSNNIEIDNNNICYSVIKNYILNNNYSIPQKLKKVCIKIDKPLKLTFVPYTGSNLDILSGLYYLETNFDNVKTTLTKNFIENKKLLKYYKLTGKNNFNPFGSDFYNIEIIWNKQKLIFPDTFKMLLLNLNKRFFISPIGIETDIGYHSNILIYDSKLKLVERFEPNGSTGPYGYHYNSSTLDKILKFKLSKYIDDFNYIYPKKYLPKIGLQMYDNIEQKKKRIGDPGGYCSSWSLWYAKMVLTYPNISRFKLINKLIYTIKNQISFKENIRYFTNVIINIRDLFLKDTGIDINDWINNNYNINQYNKLIENIKNKL